MGARRIQENFCDRCGAQSAQAIEGPRTVALPKPETWATVELPNRGYVDLCFDCVGALIAWFQDGGEA